MKRGRVNTTQAKQKATYKNGPYYEGIYLL